MEVSADEYMNWGRTRLRVELKKRGLSPSGLKTELLARLEDYFKRQRGASGGAGHHLQHQPTSNHNHAPSFNNNRASGPAASSPSTSSSSSPAGQQHHLLPKQHHSKQLLDLFHQQHSQQLLHQQHSESATLGRAVPRKRPRKSQTPQRGLQPQGSADNTSSEGEGSDHSGGGSPLYGEPLTNSSSHHYLHLGNDFPSSSSSAHASKKPRLDHKHQQQQHESDDSNEGVPTKVQPTPLSGRAFKKESGQVQAPHAEVRSVETIAFGPGDHFHFTHRFWRGKLLRRRFDFYGTYSIVPATTATPSEAASASATPVAGPLSSGEGLHLDDLVALSCAFAAEAGEKDGAAEESRLRELTEGKVILHWPSKLDAPELRDWQFDKSYSHLFLAATSAPSTSPSRTGLSSSSDSASPQPGSTSPVLGAGGSEVRISPKRPHFLYTKHSAVFVEDTC